MVECGVCCQIYEEGITKCPKLLPCAHTFCISCLKRIWDQEGSGGIKCPYCRTFHQIPSGHVDNLPTNQKLLKEVTTKNKIFTLPSSGKALRINDGLKLCEQHGNPAVTIIYNVMNGTRQRFCETCLNPDSYIISERDSNERTGEGARYQQAPYARNNHTEGTAYDISRMVVSFFGRNEESEIVLNPTALTTEQFGCYETPSPGVQNMEPISIRWSPEYDNTLPRIMESESPPGEDIWITNTNETTNRDLSLSEILKRLAFILSSPLIVNVGIIIALFTTAIAIITGLCHATYGLYFYCKGCSEWDTITIINKFVTTPFNKYEHAITRLFCFGDEVGDSRIISKFCQGLATIVKLVVIFFVVVVFVCCIFVAVNIIIGIAYTIWLLFYCACLCIRKII